MTEKQRLIIEVNVYINDLDKINNLIREGWNISLVKESKSNTNDWDYKFSLSREI